MGNLNREDIHIITRHSNLTEQEVAGLLHKNVYNGRAAWQKFLRIFFVSLGIGFATTGVVFFFAYNWDQLHKFVKIGLIEGLLIAATLLTLFGKINDTVRRIILTGASILVGVLFAVFGQIYQTGANACDFFLVWTIFVTLWVAVSNFPPLWLLYLALINTTFILYSQQVASDWSGVFVCTWLFVLNAAALIPIALFARVHVPSWFINTVSLVAAGYATIGIIIGIYDRYRMAFPVLILLTAIVYALALWYALRKKNIFYLALIPFSLIIIFSAWLLKISDKEMMFLTVCLFIISGVTFVIKALIDVQGKWINEKQRGDQ